MKVKVAPEPIRRNPLETVFPGHAGLSERGFFIVMKIKINGEDRQIDDGLTLTALLESLQIRPGRVVVERNRDIVPRDSYNATSINDGDILEIVHFVGGG